MRIFQRITHRTTVFFNFNYDDHVSDLYLTLTMLEELYNILWRFAFRLRISCKCLKKSLGFSELPPRGTHGTHRQLHAREFYGCFVSGARARWGHLRISQYQMLCRMLSRRRNEMRSSFGIVMRRNRTGAFRIVTGRDGTAHPHTLSRTRRDRIRTGSPCHERMGPK